MDCKTLTEITVDENNPIFSTDGNAIYETYDYSYEDYDGEIIEDYDRYLVYYIPSKATEKITIPSDITDISDYAFYYCPTVEEISASTLETIGTKAFIGTNLKKISFDGECFVYDSAFKGCSQLTSVPFENIVYIATGAFQDCTSLKDVTLNDEVSVIDGHAFANTAIEEITVNGDYLYLGEGAFQGCKNLKRVTLGNGVIYVGMNAFLDCPRLETVYLSKTIDDFEENALNGCENVKFEVIRNTDAHRYVKKQGYNFEIVGKLTFLEEITNFFRRINEFLFGWMQIN